MNRRKIVVARALSLCAAAFFAATAAAQPPKQMDMRPNAAALDREAIRAERKAYHDWLVSERVVTARANALVMTASDEQLRSVDDAPRQFPEIVGISTGTCIQHSGDHKGNHGPDFHCISGTSSGLSITALRNWIEAELMQ